MAWRCGGRNAVQEIGTQPFGQVLLVLTAVGLFGYASWRFVQAAVDPENNGTDGKGVIKRVGYVASGAMHTALGVTAIQLVTGGGGGGRKKTWIAELMAVDTIGPILVGLAGVFVLGYALYQVHEGWTMKFKEELRTGQMSRTEEKAATISGRVGLVARAVVFAIIGGFVSKAAATQNPGSAKSVGGALSEIASQSDGVVLLATVAVGLLAHAALQLVLARYRAIPSPA